MAEKQSSPAKYEPRWHLNHHVCTHMDDNVCPYCDFDGYYAYTYPTCPWREVDA